MATPADQTRLATLAARPCDGAMSAEFVHSVLTWLAVLGLVIGLNIVPAFMPPTWTVLAYFHMQEGFDVVSLAIVGALGATVGRAILALVSRTIGERVLPRRWRTNIESLVDELQRRKELGVPALVLFALGPIPSNQLFVAAGIAHAPLPPLLAIFGVARFLSYVVWINVADTAASTLQDVIAPRFGVGAATLAQVAALIGLIAIMQIDWRRVLR